MADEELLHKIQNLGDLDLATLLCLVSREHCIISTEPEALDDLVEELRLVATESFNLTPTVVNLTPQTTLDDFAASILLPTSASRSSSPRRTRTPASDSYFHAHANAALHPNAGHPNALRTLSPLSQISSNQAQSAQIANIILARDLDKAPKAVQIQALELLRTRRIFTRTSVQAAPKQFLFIAILGAQSGGQARLTEHLNDFFYVAHWHDPLDGFARLEDRGGRQGFKDGKDSAGFDGEDGDSDSTGRSDRSVVRHSRVGTPKTPRTEFDKPRGNTDHSSSLTEHDITSLALASRTINVDVEVLRYQMNLVSHLRMHHAVSGGIVPTATQHFDILIRGLATLHGLDYVTPALVVLAVRKIYLHRIRITEAGQERSMQWGSELAAVEQLLLDGVGPEDVIEDVVAEVECPL